MVSMNEHKQAALFGAPRLAACSLAMAERQAGAVL